MRSGLEETIQEVSQGAEGKRATNPLSGCTDPAWSTLFLLDNVVFAVPDRFRLRGTQADRKPAATSHATNEHADGEGRIGEAINGRSRNVP
jgi:hypothetical protein